MTRGPETPRYSLCHIGVSVVVGVAVGVRVTVGVRVAVGVLVEVAVAVIVGVSVARTGMLQREKTHKRIRTIRCILYIFH